MAPSFSEKNKKINTKIGIAISYAAMVFSVCSTLFYQPFLLRSLGSSSYGLYSYANSMTSWLSLMTLGLSSTYIRFATLEEKENQEKGVSQINGLYFAMFSIISLLSLLAGGILVVLFHFNAFHLTQYSEDELSTIVILIGIATLLTSSDFLLSFFPLYETFRYRFIFVRSMELLSRILTLVFSILVIINKGNIIGIAISGLASSILVGILSIVYSFAVLHIKITFRELGASKTKLGQILPFTMWIFLNTIIHQINTNLGSTVLGSLYTPESVTIYTLGLEMYSYSTVASTAVSSAFIPEINKLVVDGKKEELDALFLKISAIQSFVMVLIAGGFVFCGKEFVSVWVGDKYSQVYYISSALLVVATVPFSQTAGTEIQRAMNKHKFRTVFYLILSVFNVAITILSVKFLPNEYKVYGAVGGTVVSIFIIEWVVMNVYYSKKLHLPIRPYFKVFLIIASVGTVITVLLSLLFKYAIILTNLKEWIIVVIKALCFASFYILTIFLLFRKKITAYFRKQKD